MPNWKNSLNAFKVVKFNLKITAQNEFRMPELSLGNISWAEIFYFLSWRQETEGHRRLTFDQNLV